MKITDELGDATRDLLLCKWRACIENGQVIFGMGKHQSKNVDGNGQSISVAACDRDSALMDKTWEIGSRVDEMRFHWDLDAARAQKVAILVHTLKLDGAKAHGGFDVLGALSPPGGYH